MKKILMLTLAIMMISAMTGCGRRETTSSMENEYTKNIMEQAATEQGYPAVDDFFEHGQLLEIYELRDDPNLLCYWYTKSAMSGKWVYEGECIGYGIPYSTQITQPETLQLSALPAINMNGEDRGFYEYSQQILPQAEPNGLYSTGSTTATWILSIDEEKGEIKPVYVEDAIRVQQSKIDSRRCEDWSLPGDYNITSESADEKKDN